MTLWNNNEPIWNEIFLFTKTEFDVITLVVKDDDVWSKDEELLRIEIPLHYQKIKSVTQEGLSIDIGNVFYKARVINYKNKRKIDEQNDEIVELQDTLGDFKITTSELRESLDKVSNEKIILSKKIIEIQKIIGQSK